MKTSTLKRKTPLQRSSSAKGKSDAWKRRRSKRARAKDFSPNVKRIVRERSGGMCERCRVRRLMEYHHCRFRSDGGTGELSNCLGLCIWCHKEDPDSAHKSKETREWCVKRARELADGEYHDDSLYG